MKRIKKFVERHLLREKSGNEHSYETSLRGTHEDIRANPDSLIEGQYLWGDNPATRPQQLMAEAIDHLQGRQKEVYLLTMRSDRSLAEAGEILGITKAAVQNYKERAIKFITAYCKTAIAKGDLQ